MRALDELEHQRTSLRFERISFKQAFLEEHACRHVIQSFVND